MTDTKDTPRTRSGISTYAATGAVAKSSKMYSGSLKLGPVGAGQKDFSCLPTAVAITPPDAPDESLDEVLCGDPVEPEDSETLEFGNLTFTALQDFHDTAGLIQYSWSVAKGTYVDYEWTTRPDVVGGITVTGTVRVWPLEFGGDVGRGKRLTTEAEWLLGEWPTFTPYVSPGMMMRDAESGDDGVTYEETS